MDDVIQAHLDLCEKVYNLLVEENRILKTTESPPPADFLSKKEELLPQLDESLSRLKILKPELLSPFGTTRDLIKKAQNKLLKILYLDKENEELLLRNSLGHKPVSITSVISPVEAKKMFEENKAGR
jgi:hypothetical protein